MIIREVSFPVMTALLGLAAAAWLYHCVREHHVHLVIARKVNPAVRVPATRHDTGWHAMSHRSRLGIDIAVVIAAACLGLGWQLERTATAAGAVIALTVTVAVLAVRALSRAIGQRQRYRHAPDLDQEE
jgi:hypothetical protein